MTQCVEWLGRRSPSGYGVMYHEGKEERVHRVSYCQANGVSLESIKGLFVRHSCDNRGCCEPEHLILGTHLDNMDDMTSRGRQNKGKDRPQSKLTDEIVSIIRCRFKPQCRKNGARALGREFGVHNSIISRICDGTLWKSLGEEV